MPKIGSPNPDLPRVEVNTQMGGSPDPGYVHPIESRPSPRPIPMAFQVTSPFNRNILLLPHALVLHVNPTSLQETGNQKVERIQTRGGFVEQHWGHDLIELSADGSTGAFMNIRTGLTSVLRQRTIAWDRFRDLHDLFRHNGSVYDPFGNIVLQGDVMLMFDRGIYFGGFRSFSFDETAESPFSFKVSWTFKVTQTVQSIDVFRGMTIRAPDFQSLNTKAARTPEDARNLAEYDAAVAQQNAQQQQSNVQGAIAQADADRAAAVEAAKEQVTAALTSTTGAFR